MKLDFGINNFTKKYYFGHVIMRSFTKPMTFVSAKTDDFDRTIYLFKIDKTLYDELEEIHAVATKACKKINDLPVRKPWFCVEGGLDVEGYEDIFEKDEKYMIRFGDKNSSLSFPENQTNVSFSLGFYRNQNYQGFSCKLSDQ